MARRLDTATFIEKAKVIHGDKYNYDKVVYTRLLDPVIITCPTHGDFEQEATRHIMAKCGCPHCAGVAPLSTEEFIKRSKLMHGDTYGYSKTKYYKSTLKVTINCSEHGDFEQVAHSHISGSGCPKCYREYRRKKPSTVSKGKFTLERFIQLSREVHGNRYEYTRAKFSGKYIHLLITCPVHGDFKQRPVVHLLGRGCPSCNEANDQQEEKDLRCA